MKVKQITKLLSLLQPPHSPFAKEKGGKALGPLLELARIILIFDCCYYCCTALHSLIHSFTHSADDFATMQNSNNDNDTKAESESQFAIRSLVVGPFAYQCSIVHTANKLVSLVNSTIEH